MYVKLFWVDFPFNITARLVTFSLTMCLLCVRSASWHRARFLSNGSYVPYWSCLDVLSRVQQRGSLSARQLRWKRGRWGCDPPTWRWGPGTQSTVRTWWSPTSCSSSSDRRRWRWWQTGAWGKAARWRRTGRWSWRLLARRCVTEWTSATGPAD